MTAKSALGGSNHEDHRGYGYQDAQQDVGSECFAQAEGAYQDGRDGLKDTQYRGLRGSDVARSYR